MVGDVQHARRLAVVVVADEVEVRVVGHVRRRHRDVLVARDVGARRVVDFIVRAGGDWEVADVAFAVIHHGVHVGREDGLVVVVDVHGRVGPPEEGLGLVGAVGELHVDLQHGAIGMEREGVHALREEHALDLGADHCRAAVGVLDELPLDGHVRARAMVLGPVELDAARDPRPGQADQRGLDDLVVVDEVIAVGLIERHLHATAQLGQDHDLEIAVLEVDGRPRLERGRIGDLIDDGVGVDGAAAALVDAFLQEHRVAVRLADAIGRDLLSFLPDADAIG